MELDFHNYMEMKTFKLVPFFRDFYGRESFVLLLYLKIFLLYCSRTSLPKLVANVKRSSGLLKCRVLEIQAIVIHDWVYSNKLWSKFSISKHPNPNEDSKLKTTVSHFHLNQIINFLKWTKNEIEKKKNKEILHPTCI